MKKLSDSATLAYGAGSEWKDRRRYKRIPMAGKIQYRLHDADLSSADSWNVGEIEDFSYGGIRITVPQAIAKGQEIILKLTLPIHNSATELEGRIAWARPCKGQSDCTEVGISFSKKSTYQVQVVDAAANEMVAVALKSASELTARRALSIDDFQHSLALAYKEYEPFWSGPADNWSAHCNRWIFSKNACTFLLERDNQLFGTLTFIPDSEYGLPSDSNFSKELATLNRPGHKLAEVTLLALDNEKLTDSLAKTDLARFAASLRLLKIAFDHARRTSITDLIVAAPSTQQNIYSYLLFNRLSNATSPSYEHSLIPMHLDVIAAIEDAEKLQTAVLSYLYNDPEPEVAIALTH